MAEKTKETKITMEREYTVPLRQGFLHVPYYKRTPKAIKTLKEFIARHMKIENHDTSKILVDKYLNQQFWHRGIRKPPAKIKVRAKKFDDGTVSVELVDIHPSLKWKMEKEKRMTEEGRKAKEKAKAEEKAEKQETAQELKEKEEKKESVVEAGLKQQEQEHIEAKHQAAPKKQQKQPLARKALQK